VKQRSTEAGHAEGSVGIGCLPWPQDCAHDLGFEGWIPYGIHPTAQDDMLEGPRVRKWSRKRRKMQTSEEGMDGKKSTKRMCRCAARNE